MEPTVKHPREDCCQNQYANAVVYLDRCGPLWRKVDIWKWDFKKTRYIGRNYSHYKRIICLTKGFTAGFLLNSSLKAFKTGSDLRSFSRMLLCKERHTCDGYGIVLQGFFCFVFFHPILLSLQRNFFQHRKCDYTDPLNSYLCLYFLILIRFQSFLCWFFSLKIEVRVCVLSSEILWVRRVVLSFSLAS